MAEYTSLLSDLAENITNEDLEQLKSACKEDIPEDQSNNITSSKEWFSYLEKNDKLAQGGIVTHWRPQFVLSVAALKYFFNYFVSSVFITNYLR